MITKEFRDFLRGVTKTLQQQSKVVANTQAHLRNDSKLIKSFQVRVRPDFRVLQFLALEYLEYVEKGRKAGARKVPIRALIEWITRYNITAPNKTTNQLAYAIQTNIFKYGLEPRPMLTQIESSIVNTLVKQAGDELEKSIADEFVRQFKI